MGDELHITMEPHSFGDPDECELRVSPELGEDLMEALRSEGYELSLAAEFSSGVADTLMVVGGLLVAAGGLSGLAAFVTAWSTRHVGKEVSVKLPDGTEVRAAGMAPRKLNATVNSHLERAADQQDTASTGQDTNG